MEDMINKKNFAARRKRFRLSSASRKTRPWWVASLVTLLFLVSVVSPHGSLSGSPTPDGASLREPFVLVLPDLESLKITGPVANVPSVNFHSIRFLIRQPFADSIDYGKIYTTINGEAAGTIQDVRSGRDGHVVICDLDRKPRFQLRPGKNVVEILAVDQSRKQYYASYVLIAGHGGIDNSAYAAGALLESSTVNAGEDRQPPVISLQEPAGPVQFTKAAPVKVQGVVSDDSGAVAHVKVNGQPARLAAARSIAMRPGAPANAPADVKGSVAFELAVSLSEGAESIEIEAKDRAGNVARLLVPVHHRAAAMSSQFKGQKLALVVGISKYRYNEGGLTDLDYADADARSIRDFLQQPEGGGFSPSNILFLENEAATLDAVRSALNDFLPKAGPNDLIFIFLAGHGSPDFQAPQNLYFIMHDTKVSDMANTALPMVEFKESLQNNVRAKRVVVMVDTCHSAGLSGEKLVKTRALENNLINFYASKLYNETGSAVLTSSDINEVSRESRDWGGGHGIFTLAILDGFKGKADKDADLLVTAGELFNYVRERVRAETDSGQNPRALPGLNAGLALAVVRKR